MTTPDPLKLARDVLQKLACLGNGDKPGNSTGNVIALTALAEIDALPVTELAATIYVEVLECPECQHIGINDDDGTSACTHCDWHGPSPVEDHCPGCGSDGTMTTACTECGHRTALLASATLPVSSSAITAPAAPATAPDYLDGVNIPSLIDALVWLGYSTEGHEATGANLAFHVNNITSAVLLHKDLFQAPTAPAAPALQRCRLAWHLCRCA